MSAFYCMEIIPQKSKFEESYISQKVRMHTLTERKQGTPPADPALGRSPVRTVEHSQNDAAAVFFARIRGRVGLCKIRVM